MTLGERIREQRVARSWSQRDLSLRMGNPSGANIGLSRIERGVLNPRIDTLSLIAAIFAMTVQELIAPVEFSPTRRVRDGRVVTRRRAS